MFGSNIKWVFHILHRLQKEQDTKQLLRMHKTHFWSITFVKLGLIDPKILISKSEMSCLCEQHLSFYWYSSSFHICIYV